MLLTVCHGLHGPYGCCGARAGMLNLIDLAGSERLKTSNASGDRLKETQAINKSLSALGTHVHHSSPQGLATFSSPLTTCSSTSIIHPDILDPIPVL